MKLIEPCILDRYCMTKITLLLEEKFYIEVKFRNEEITSSKMLVFLMV